MYNTGLGASMTIFVSVITLTFLISNMHVMINYKGSTISTSISDGALTYNDTVTSQDGFRIAIGIDPGYGAENIYDYLEIEVNVFAGDYTGDPIIEKDIKYELYNCTEEDYK